MGRRKRATKKLDLKAPLHYFNMAMKMDKHLCLPQMFCEAAATDLENEETTIRSKATTNTTKNLYTESSAIKLFTEDVINLADLL